MTNKLITITGPSCSGKTTLQNLLQDRGLQPLVSFTTRNKREGEVNGIDYWFMTTAEIRTLEGDGQIAELIDLNGNLYGLLGSELKNKLLKGNCIAVVEPNGVNQLAKYCKEQGHQHIRVYISNPVMVNVGRILKRLRGDSLALELDYAKRIISLTSSEQLWIYQAEYDMIFTRFDSECQENVIKNILRGLDD